MIYELLYCSDPIYVHLSERFLLRNQKQYNFDKSKTISPRVFIVRLANLVGRVVFSHDNFAQADANNSNSHEFKRSQLQAHTQLAHRRFLRANKHRKNQNS